MTESRICPRCKRPILEGEGVYTITGEHYDCWEKFMGPLKAALTSPRLQIRKYRKAPGRIKQRLAALLQKEFPTRAGFAVRWDPEHIICPRGGFWRTSSHVNNQAARWDAHAEFDDKSLAKGNTAYSVCSYYTMTELLKVGALEIIDDEIYPRRQCIVDTTDNNA